MYSSLDLITTFWSLPGENVHEMVGNYVMYVVPLVLKYSSVEFVTLASTFPLRSLIIMFVNLHQVAYVRWQINE